MSTTVTEMEENCQKQSNTSPSVAAAPMTVNLNGHRPHDELAHNVLPDIESQQNLPVWPLSPRYFSEIEALFDDELTGLTAPSSQSTVQSVSKTLGSYVPATKNTKESKKRKRNTVDPSTHNQEASKPKRSVSEPELLVDAFQAKKGPKGKFAFDNLHCWKNIHTKFQGEWDNGFTGNGRTPTTPKSMTYKAVYKESHHALIRVYQTPLPTTPTECRYKVFFNRILFWEIEALHTEYRKTIALVKTYVLGLSDNHILQFFDFTRSVIPPNYEQQLEKAKGLLSHFHVQTIASTESNLQYKKGSIIVMETGDRKLNVSSATCSSDDYIEALMKYVQLLPTTVTIKSNTIKSNTIKSNTVVFDHSRFSATVDDDGRLNLTWCISVINNDDADLDNANHTSIIDLMQLEKFGDHLTSAFLSSIDKKLAAIKRCISIEKKNTGKKKATNEQQEDSEPNFKVPACSDTATAAHVPLNCHKRPANEAFNPHKMNGATTYSTNSQSQEPEDWVHQVICKIPRITHEEFAEVMSDAVPPAQSPTSSTDESLQPQTDSHAAPATPKPKTNIVDPPTHTPAHTQAATKSKKCMSEPELLVNAFQAQTWSKGKFNFATSLPYWESIHTKFQGEWGKGFTGNGRATTTTKSMTYKATYKGSLHALIRVYQTPLPTTPECQYKVFFNKILFWEIEAFEEYGKTTALLNTYMVGLPDDYIMQFFQYIRCNEQRNHEQHLEKAKRLLADFQTQELHSKILELKFQQG